jgi:hypothetical protein
VKKGGELFFRAQPSVSQSRFFTPALTFSSSSFETVSSSIFSLLYYKPACMPHHGTASIAVCQCRGIPMVLLIFFADLEQIASHGSSGTPNRNTAGDFLLCFDKCLRYQDNFNCEDIANGNGSSSLSACIQGLAPSGLLFGRKACEHA